MMKIHFQRFSTSIFDGWITIFHGSTHLFWTISSHKISGSPQPVASHSHHHASRNREFHPAAARCNRKMRIGGGSIVMVIQWYPKKWTVWSWKIHLSNSIYGWFGGPWLRKSQEREWGSKPKWETHRVKVNNIRCPTNKRLGFVSYGYLIYLTPRNPKNWSNHNLKGNQDQNGRKQPYLWYHFVREDNQSKQLWKPARHRIYSKKKVTANIESWPMTRSEMKMKKHHEAHQECWSTNVGETKWE